MSGSTPRVVNIGSTLGATFIGLIFSTILYGITIVQAWIYFCPGNSGRKDSMKMRGFVAFLLVLDTVHKAFCIYVLYWYLIQNFADIANLDINMWAQESQVSISALLAFLIQLFYVRRLYLMSHNIVLLVIVVALASLVLVMCVVFSIRQHALRLFSRDGSLVWMTCVGMGGTTIVDLLIALSMCWCLYRKKTGFARTDSMIISLMIYVFSSGILTSIFASATLISFIIAPATLIAQGFYGPLGACYMNSFLALLNNRNVIQERYQNDGCGSSHLTQTGPAISVTVHRTASVAMEFVGSKHDPEPEPSALELKGLESASTHSAHEGFSKSTV